MHFLNGITILLVYELVGEITVLLLPIAIPGPVLGMAMLFSNTPHLQPIYTRLRLSWDQHLKSFILAIYPRRRRAHGSL